MPEDFCAQVVNRLLADPLGHIPSGEGKDTFTHEGRQQEHDDEGEALHVSRDDVIVDGALDERRPERTEIGGADGQDQRKDDPPLVGHQKRHDPPEQAPVEPLPAFPRLILCVVIRQFLYLPYKDPLYFFRRVAVLEYSASLSYKDICGLISGAEMTEKEFSRAGVRGNACGLGGRAVPGANGALGVLGREGGVVVNEVGLTCKLNALVARTRIEHVRERRARRRRRYDIRRTDDATVGKRDVGARFQAPELFMFCRAKTSRPLGIEVAG